MAQPAADQDKPFYSRFIAYNDKNPDFVYAAADGTNAYPINKFFTGGNEAAGQMDCSALDRTLSFLRKMHRHFLFVKNKYFVVFDDLKGDQPATFTSLYHVQENRLTADFTNGAFSYLSMCKNIIKVRLRKTTFAARVDPNGTVFEIRFCWFGCRCKCVYLII